MIDTALDGTAIHLALLPRAPHTHIIIVTGWRHATDAHTTIIRNALTPLLIDHGSNVLLRHGRCKYGGADLLADLLAHRWGWQTDPMPADEHNGRILGSRRNQNMCAKQPRAQQVFAFPGPGSTGTWDCLKHAADHGIIAHIYPLNPIHPKDPQ